MDDSVSLPEVVPVAGLDSDEETEADGVGNDVSVPVQESVAVAVGVAGGVTDGVLDDDG